MTIRYITQKVARKEYNETDKKFKAYHGSEIYVYDFKHRINF